MPASREQKQSEKILKKAFDCFPSLFNKVWFLAGGTLGKDFGVEEEWREDTFRTIDYVIEDLVLLKKALREEVHYDFGEKKLLTPQEK